MSSSISTSSKRTHRRHLPVQNVSVWNAYRKDDVAQVANQGKVIGFYIRDSLFHDMKFVTPEMLDYSDKEKTLCQKMCTVMRIEPSWQRDWWTTAIGHIIECMRKRRSDCHTSMKRNFIGTSQTRVCLFVQVQ